MNYISLLKFGLPAATITTLLVSIIAYVINQPLIPHFVLNFVASTIGLVIYLFLNNRFSNNELDKFSLSLSNLLLGLCIAMLFFTHSKLYSVITFSILFISMLLIEYWNKIRFMYRFYRAFLLSVIIYGAMVLLMRSSLGPVPFEKTIGLSIGGLPFESIFYHMTTLLLTVYLFEVFRYKIAKR